MNNVSLIGRLTKDLELKKTPTNTSVTSFILAVNRRFKSEGQPDADFIRCIAWNKTAETMCKYLKKGSQIGVEGRIQTGQYEDKSGATVYTTDIVVEQFTFVGSNENNGNANDMDNNSTLDISSDDLPF